MKFIPAAMSLLFLISCNDMPVAGKKSQDLDPLTTVQLKYEVDEKLEELKQQIDDDLFQQNGAQAAHFNHSVQSKTNNSVAAELKNSVDVKNEEMKQQIDKRMQEIEELKLQLSERNQLIAKLNQLIDQQIAELKQKIVTDVKLVVNTPSPSSTSSTNSSSTVSPSSGSASSTNTSSTVAPRSSSTTSTNSSSTNVSLPTQVAAKAPYHLNTYKKYAEIISVNDYNALVDKHAYAFVVKSCFVSGQVRDTPTCKPNDNFKVENGILAFIVSKELDVKLKTHKEAQLAAKNASVKLMNTDSTGKYVALGPSRFTEIVSTQGYNDAVNVSAELFCKSQGAGCTESYMQALLTPKYGAARVQAEINLALKLRAHYTKLAGLDPIKTVDDQFFPGSPAGEEWVRVPKNAGGLGLPEFFVMKYEAKALYASGFTVTYTSEENGVKTTFSVGTSVAQEKALYQMNRDRKLVRKPIDFSKIQDKRNADIGHTIYTPVSFAEKTPWNGLNEIDSAKACEGRGPGFHLISNHEWMAIARDLENVGANWSGGRVGSGCLFRGNSSSGHTVSAISGVNDCGYASASLIPVDNRYHYYTGIIGVPDSGHDRNPTAKLTLSNGEQIFDFSGNQDEYVDFDMTLAGYQEKKSRCSLETNAITGSCLGLPDEHFKSQHGPVAFLRSRMINNDGTTYETPIVTRGGSYLGGIGPFQYAERSFKGFGKNENGFRCVYRPISK